MQRIGLFRDWRFRYGPGVQGVHESREWTTVDLPHDAGIHLDRSASAVGGYGTGYFPGCNCFYERDIEIPSGWLGGNVTLEFEGVYMNAVVTVNQNLAARHPYGYTTFRCDITPWLKEGMNKLRVEVYNGGLANSRWYSGTGIYRPVYLLVGDKVRVDPWDIAVSTPEVQPDLSIARIRTTIRNGGTSPAPVRLRTTILAEGATIGVSETPADIPAQGSIDLEQEVRVRDARVWSLDDPFLHVLRTEVLMAGKTADTTETRFGFRTLSFDAVEGFRLNCGSMKLKGGCVHHDCGLVGSAAYARAEERKVELLKASGFNAVRTAHNPPSVAFLEACDRLGMLVIDEAFDCFRIGKNPGDYSMHFEEWWRRDIESMVLRDRNHPCIVMWSTGNEIVERDGKSHGAEWSRKLADHVRSLDSTRPVMNAINDFWLSVPEGMTAEESMDHWERETTEFAAPLDVVGYNYLLHRYERDAERYPGRVICGTETFPFDAFDYWEATERLPHVIGDFVWTSMDYLGESGIGHVKYGSDLGGLMPYPWLLANCGDIDPCGRKRPQSYYRDCLWSRSESPYIAVHAPENHDRPFLMSAWDWYDVSASWNWKGWEGRPCRVDVYSRDEEVVLLLDGEILGKAEAGRKNRYIATFETVYRPGVLEAVGVSHGREQGRSLLETSGEPACVRMAADRAILAGGFGDLAYVGVEIVDEKGRLVTDGTNALRFAVEGPGRILAVGNGDPVSEEPYVGCVRSAWRGVATVVVRADGQPGSIFLSAESDGLEPARIEIRVP